MSRIFLFFYMVFFVFNISSASDIVEIVTITNKILAIHFDDGYAVYHKKGQARNNEYVVVELLNINQAEIKSNYSISSKTDAKYLSSKQPVDIGRKSIGVEFTWMC